MVQGILPRGITGRIIVTRNAFLVTGGYDEKYENHSPDDKDFNMRLRDWDIVDRKLIPAIFKLSNILTK